MNNRNNKTLLWLKDNYFYFLAFLIPFVLMLIAYAKAGMHPFGDKQIMVYDCWHQYFPFAQELVDKIKSGDSLLYTLRSGFGQDFLGIMSYYTASPLNFLASLFPAEHLREFFMFFMCIKVGCAGLFMSMFLKHTFKKGGFAIVLFSVPYALSAFIMGYGWNIMWIDTVALLPLVALGAVSLVRDGKFKLYVISLAVAFFANFYIGFFVCIFMVMLFIALVIIYKLNIKQIIKRLWQMALFSVIGIAITAILILPAYLALKQTYSANNSTWPDLVNFYKSVPEILSSLLAYREPSVLEGLPNLYSSLLAVLMAGVFFVVSKINLREKIVCGVTIVFLALSANVNVLDYIWHGFHFTNQIPFRFLFLFTFVILVMAYHAFISLEEIKWYHVFTATVVLAVMIVLVKVFTDTSSSVINKNLILGLLYISFLLILLAKYKKLNFKVVSVLMVIPLCFEMYASAVNGVNATGTTSYETYYDSNEEIQELLTESNPKDDDFYRTEMYSWYTINDPVLYQYYGISQFSSMSNTKTAEYMENLGIVGNPGENKYYYTATTPFAQSLMNLKYVISKSGVNVDEEHLNEVSRSGNAKLLQSTTYMPFGFMAKNSLKDFKLSNPNNPFYYQNALFKSMTGIDKDLYSYVSMTSSDNSGGKLSEDDATGNYTLSPVSDDGKISLFNGEKALNNSKEDVAGVKANTYYQLTPEELLEATEGDYEGLTLQVTYKYQNDEATWKKDADIFFYADNDNINTVTDFNYVGGNSVKFPIEISTDIQDRGLVIEGFGVIITDVSLVSASANEIVNSKSATINMKYKVPSDASLYCYFNSDEIGTVYSQIGDEERFSSVQEKNLQYCFPLGKAKKGETVTISGTTDEAISQAKTITCLVYSLDEDVLNEGLEKLKTMGEYDISEHTSTYFKGEINASEDGVMYTAIAESGWEAYVDGEKVDKVTLCDALLGVPLTKGVHTVELKYTSPGFIAGIIISIVGLLAFILACIVSSKIKKKSLIEPDDTRDIIEIEDTEEKQETTQDNMQIRSNNETENKTE